MASTEMAGADWEDDAELDLPTNTKKDIATVDSALSTSIHLWLRRRKKNVRPKLSADQQLQLKECFELMDQDGSGAIDADELGAAFKLLGIGLRKSEVEQILDDVGMNADGEVEYPQFLEIMTVTLLRLAEAQAEDKGSSSQVPFSLMATAYRRKRLMEGIISGDKETMGQIVQLSERQAQDAAVRDAACAAAAARKASEAAATGSGLGSRGGNSHKPPTGMAKRSMARLTRMHVDGGLLMQLSPEERQLLNQVANRTQQQHHQPLASISPLRRQGTSHSSLLPHYPSSPAPHKRGNSPQFSSRGSPQGFGMQSGKSPIPPSALLATDRMPGLSNDRTPRYAASDSGCLPPLGGDQWPSSQLGVLKHTDDNHSIPRRYSSYSFSHSPQHQQLVGVPQCFDLKFTNVRPMGHPTGTRASRSAASGLPFPSATRPLQNVGPLSN